MNKAFLKWAGGKSQSLDFILEAVGEIEGRFIEPFVGSGVVMLNANSSNVIISDFNEDLINLYKILKISDDFIDTLKFYFSGEFNNADSFYSLREKFNNSSSIEEKSAIFVYLNRHCFNGLCRYNKSGKFNVPFGKYKKINLPEREIITFKQRLECCEIIHCSFENVIKLSERGDVIYCDPPFVPLSLIASFTDYSVGGFTKEQQKELAKLAEESKAKVLISNHDTEFTREIYKNSSYIKTKEVKRFISAKSSSRGMVSELLAVYNN